MTKEQEKRLEQLNSKLAESLFSPDVYTDEDREEHEKLAGIESDEDLRKRFPDVEDWDAVKKESRKKVEEIEKKYPTQDLHGSNLKVVHNPDCFILDEIFETYKQTPREVCGCCGQIIRHGKVNLEVKKG